MLLDIDPLRIYYRHVFYSTMPLFPSVLQIYVIRHCHSPIGCKYLSFSTLPLFPAVVYIYVTRQCQCQCHSSHPPDNVTPPICCQHLCYSTMSMSVSLLPSSRQRHSSHLLSTSMLLDNVNVSVTPPILPTTSLLPSVVNIYVYSTLPLLSAVNSCVSPHCHSSHILSTSMFLGIAVLPMCGQHLRYSTLPLFSLLSTFIFLDISTLPICC